MSAVWGCPSNTVAAAGGYRGREAVSEGSLGLILHGSQDSTKLDERAEDEGWSDQ